MNGGLLQTMSSSARKITAVSLSAWIFILAAGVHLFHNHGIGSETGRGHEERIPACCCAALNRHETALSCAEVDSTPGVACPICSFLHQYVVSHLDVTPYSMMPLPNVEPCIVGGLLNAGGGDVHPGIPRAPPSVKI
jgi:hypothetical protein